MGITKKIIVHLLFTGVVIGLLAFTLAQTNPWVVPEKYNKMTNPVKAEKKSLDNGKRLWDKMCKSCHGSKGLGDGIKARDLKTPAGDFSKDLKNQTDGALFYKTAEGRGEMPGYKGKASENEMWDMVNFMRTL
ncbi:MAG: cytochrome c [Bacteroidetes bacterium]|nr:cytochrome c [Bacteroidota bacterium]